MGSIVVRCVCDESGISSAFSRCQRWDNSHVLQLGGCSLAVIRFDPNPCRLLPSSENTATSPQPASIMFKTETAENQRPREAGPDFRRASACLLANLHLFHFFLTANVWRQGCDCKAAPGKLQCVLGQCAGGCK